MPKPCPAPERSSGRRDRLRTWWPLLGAAMLACSGQGRALAQEMPSPVLTRFIPVARGVPGVMYEPVAKNAKAETAVLIMHSAGDYLTFPGCSELAKRGYRALCVNNSTSKSGAYNDGIFDNVLLELKAAMQVLRREAGVKQVFLLGHSGGGSVMSAYQMIAEQGVAACQDAQKIWKCSSDLAGLPKADGLMLIDSNWGLGAMTLFSLDPAIRDENSGTRLDPKLDMFNPANGFKPEGSHYDPAFRRRFLSAVARRNNGLIDEAQHRLSALAKGEGPFEDDAPFTIPGAVLLGSNNKLFAQDTTLMSHTSQAYPLLHADGTVTQEVIRSVRVPENTRNLSPSLLRGALKTSLRSYLNTFAIRVTPDFDYDASGVRGIEWQSSYASPPGNVQAISAPLLVMGMTGHWEFLAAETIYNLASSKEKSIAFVEGADHLFVTCRPCESKPGQFGDTQAKTYDFIANWLDKHLSGGWPTGSTAIMPPLSTAEQKPATVAE